MAVILSKKGVLAIPNSGKNFPILIFFPGGGYTSATIGDNPFALVDLYEALHCNRGKIAVAKFTYRLAPKNRWPAQLEDAIAAVKKIREIASQHNLDSDNIIIMGHSAGAHLALMTGLQSPSVFGNNFSGFRGIINYSGITNFQVNNATILNIAKNLGLNTKDKKIKASPLSILKVSSPPIFTLHGKADNVIPFGQAEQLVNKMVVKKVKGAFLPVENGNHVYQPGNPALPMLPDRKTIAQKAIMFARYNFGTIPAYDVTGDGHIDILDYNEIVAAQGSFGFKVTNRTVIGMSKNWNPFADINYDGFVNNIDVQLILSKIGGINDPN
jgi:acetyl esterase/lipase